MTADRELTRMINRINRERRIAKNPDAFTSPEYKAKQKLAWDKWRKENRLEYNARMCAWYHKNKTALLAKKEQARRAAGIKPKGAK